MRVLVVGSGGREHSLCWKLKQSPLLTKLYCAPGNAGIAAEAEQVPIGVEDIAAMVEFAKTRAIDLVVVGPEAPLTMGLADRLREAGITTFGPSAAAAVLEGSKGFMKDLAAQMGIPTAWYRRFSSAKAAMAFVRDQGAPMVVKADGLAAGKGVVIAHTVDEALAAIEAMMVTREFGTAGAEIVIEEFLSGEEASFFALVDGATALPLVAAQDHKAVGDGDTGPNTGGMGAYSPAPIVTPAMESQIMRRIILPAVRGMAEAGRPFTGVLFAGLMIDKNGPKLLEFNVRFGDPECQVLMARLDSDLLPILTAAAEGRLDSIAITWKPDAALVVVMAAKGYPGPYARGSEIRGLDRAEEIKGVTVFHAGTETTNGILTAQGGRVLGITARAPTVAQAQALAYRAVDAIDWPGGFCRRDIGWRALGDSPKPGRGAE